MVTVPRPLEDGVVTIIRAAMSVRFPARLTLVGGVAVNMLFPGVRARWLDTLICSPTILLPAIHHAAIRILTADKRFDDDGVGRVAQGSARLAKGESSRHTGSRKGMKIPHTRSDDWDFPITTPSRR
jgi:hypothetical protein